VVLLSGPLQEYDVRGLDGPDQRDAVKREDLECGRGGRGPHVSPRGVAMAPVRAGGPSLRLGDPSPASHHDRNP
jgi:hypothetical protein